MSDNTHLYIDHALAFRLLYTHSSIAYRHIFLELCTGGDLFSYVAHYEDNHYRLCEGEAQYIMYQLFQALEYIHSRSIAHRGEFLFESPKEHPGSPAPLCYSSDLKV